MENTCSIITTESKLLNTKYCMLHIIINDFIVFQIPIYDDVFNQVNVDNKSIFISGVAVDKSLSSEIIENIKKNIEKEKVAVNATFNLLEITSNSIHLILGSIHQHGIFHFQ